MSSHSSRILYDKCATIEDTKRITGVGQWIHNTPQEHKSACFSNNGPRDGRKMASANLDVNYRDAIDIENSLFGLDMPNTRCIDQRTLIERDNKLNKIYNDAKKRVRGQKCTPNVLELKNTRLDLYAETTEKPFDRYDYPIIDPRNWVFNGHGNKFISNTEGKDRSGRSTRHDYKVQVEPYLKVLRDQANNGNVLEAYNSRYTVQKK